LAQVEVIDARHMAMPGPLLATLAALDSLQPGVCLHLLTDRAPLLLYPLVEARGFRFRRLGNRGAAWEVLIWRDGDVVAKGAANARGTP
jgi:tRNA 2-thiouridine synthesizing protein A